MPATPVIAIFDVGKTNKKLFLFNEQYDIVWEKTTQFAETADDDGDPCEDVARLADWVRDLLQEAEKLNEFTIKAVNFSAYGASFVHLDTDGNVVGHLYNYLKPFPAALRRQFYATYGSESDLSVQTASPALDSLNSGLMLYRLKHDKPTLFERTTCSLHLPQYLSYLVTGQCFSDLTSIGCHTMLWDFVKNEYHDWVKAEGIDQRLAPIFPSDAVVSTDDTTLPYPVGIGLHDSSAALIPYLASFQDAPFILISTGTWSISMNPFNASPISPEELQYDCLCYLHYKGHPVKASRLFAGYEHEQQTKRLAEHFNAPVDYYKTVAYNPGTIQSLRTNRPDSGTSFDQVKNPPMQESLFGYRDLAHFQTYEEAYHQLMLDIVAQQLISTDLVLENSPVKRLFVDGGFSKNPIYMALLATAFPQTDVYAASVAQATALGAALAIHQHWNKQPIPTEIIQLKLYTADSIAS
ncbi:FGGY family carbohydrate kinase [Spirosoma sp. RP8]|uniref:FGGY family carbohydrate kinase n=1 Tax=Spirosoma liriopis TaxID=2937440 RepID=A0ABT0HQ02_9BACT|nr:FGGY family carbohydrate kinase [Spirosoma liriopis]MCK8494254.1 FGGY family carbohydrate kinase [Spirosoma liriopis]